MQVVSTVLDILPQGGSARRAGWQNAHAGGVVRHGKRVQLAFPKFRAQSGSLRQSDPRARSLK